MARKSEHFRTKDRARVLGCLASALHCPEVCATTPGQLRGHGLCPSRESTDRDDNLPEHFEEPGHGE